MKSNTAAYKPTQIESYGYLKSAVSEGLVHISNYKNVVCLLCY
jgi:hypothetical protein